MRIKNLNLQTTLWSAQLTIECDMKEAAELQRIIDEAGKVDSEAEYTVSIKRRKKKRSLDANAYMWVLLKELAFKVENSPIELYKYYVRGFGQYYVIPVREDALEAFSKVWSSHGVAWFVDDIGPCRRTAGYHNLKAYYGTSEYDTKSMSRLIDEVVLDCKAQGIETMSREEINYLLEGEKHEQSNCDWSAGERP